MEHLLTYQWPGNVRELQSVIKYAVVHCVGDVITPECLPESCRRECQACPPGIAERELDAVVQFVRRRLRAGEEDIYRGLVEIVDTIAVREALNHAGGNQVHASKHLGVSRTTLRAKMAGLGLSQNDPDSL
jgi:two-component system nitrogen regulation response regulator GlnG